MSPPVMNHAIEENTQGEQEPSEKSCEAAQPGSYILSRGGTMLENNANESRRVERMRPNASTGQ